MKHFKLTLTTADGEVIEEWNKVISSAQYETEETPENSAALLSDFLNVVESGDQGTLENEIAREIDRYTEK